jgi:hypothetical protein
MGGGGVSEVTTGPAEPAGLQVDDTGSGSESNGVFEPGEWVTVAPSWKKRERRCDRADRGGHRLWRVRARRATSWPTDRPATARSSPKPPRAVSTRATATRCRSLPCSRDRCIGMPCSTKSPAARDRTSPRPGPCISATASATCPAEKPNYRYVETLLHHGVVTGCGSGQFCPHDDTTRAQTAVLVLASEYGPGSAPVPCTPGQERFTDVPGQRPFLSVGRGAGPAREPSSIVPTDRISIAPARPCSAARWPLPS